MGRGALKKGDPLNIIDDQFRSPTLAEDLAQACIMAVEKRAKGIYNVSGKRHNEYFRNGRANGRFLRLGQSLLSTVFLLKD